MTGVGDPPLMLLQFLERPGACDVFEVHASRWYVTSLRSWVITHASSVDDVLKARLKTLGASEYKFEMEASAGKVQGTEWRIVDVGGSRSQVRVTRCRSLALSR